MATRDSVSMSKTKRSQFMNYQRPCSGERVTRIPAVLRLYDSTSQIIPSDFFGFCTDSDDPRQVEVCDSFFGHSDDVDGIYTRDSVR